MDNICPYGYLERYNGSAEKYIFCKLSKHSTPICAYSHMCIQCGKAKMKDNYKKCVAKRDEDNKINNK